MRAFRVLITKQACKAGGNVFITSIAGQLGNYAPGMAYKRKISKGTLIFWVRPGGYKDDSIEVYLEGESSVPPELVYLLK